MIVYSLTAPTLINGLVSTGVGAVIRPRLSVARIQNVVAAHYEVEPSEMLSDRRSREVARPRQIAMYLARHLTPKSMPDIGRRFGNRDHTTVIHAIKRVEQLMAIDGDIADDVDCLRAKLA